MQPRETINWPRSAQGWRAFQPPQAQPSSPSMAFAEDRRCASWRNAAIARTLENSRFTLMELRKGLFTTLWDLCSFRLLGFSMKAENSVRLRWIARLGSAIRRQAKKVEQSEGGMAGGCCLRGPDRRRYVGGRRGVEKRIGHGVLNLESGIPCHDTFGRVFAAIDPDEVGAAFLRWVGQVLPALDVRGVVAIDGKTSRRSGKVGEHAVASGQRVCRPGGSGPGTASATAAKSNDELTAIPVLLATLLLWKGASSPSMPWTQPNIAQAIRDQGADHVLAVKDNQPTLAASIEDFVSAFEAALQDASSVSRRREGSWPRWKPGAVMSSAALTACTPLSGCT